MFLNSSMVLTRGPTLIPGALLSSFPSATGVFTSVSVNSGDTDQTLIGQATHTAGSQCVQMTFLTPESALDSEAIPLLINHLSDQSSKLGAFRLLADVDESTLAFEALRQAGFGIYARQRIWMLAGQPYGESEEMSWQSASNSDLISVRSLYHNLIPGLVQQVEPFSEERLHGLVYRQDGELLAYAELEYGRRGIWMQPFIHPDAENVAHRLVDLFQNLPYRLSRPIYVCVRSYQSWLEPAIENLGAEPGSRQALMVKHLAVPQKALRSVSLPALNGGRPEVTASTMKRTFVMTSVSVMVVLTSIESVPLPTLVTSNVRSLSVLGEAGVAVAAPATTSMPASKPTVTSTEGWTDE